MADRGPLGKADRTGSCEVDTCGGESNSGTCFCDDACDAIGDCCDNKRDTCDEPLGLLTYNAGLARGAVTFTEERLPHVIGALREAESDVVCLQEIWDDDDVDAIAEQLADVYPHAATERTSSSSKYILPKCNPIELVSLNSCVSDCQGSGKSVFDCVANDCKEDYDELGDNCKLCLAANTTSPARCSLPAANKYAWSGRNGLMILSKRPMTDVRYSEFDTLLLKRGVITAEIDGLYYQCTHMSADLSSVPYPADERDFSTWSEEQLAQVDVISQAAPKHSCTILMGDLNTGPESTDIDSELPRSFDAFLRAGYTEPWDRRQCTHCGSNPLVGGTHSSQIDHVMTRNCSGTPTYQVVLDEAIEIVSDGERHTTRLSDHYGLRAVF